MRGALKPGADEAQRHERGNEKRTDGELRKNHAYLYCRREAIRRIGILKSHVQVVSNSDIAGDRRLLIRELFEGVPEDVLEDVLEGVLEGVREGASEQLHSGYHGSGLNGWL
jgi:hypothetical protein